MLKFCRVEIYENVSAYERGMRSKVTQMKKDKAIQCAKKEGENGKIAIVKEKNNKIPIYENHYGIEKIRNFS